MSKKITYTEVEYAEASQMVPVGISGFASRKHIKRALKLLVGSRGFASVRFEGSADVLVAGKAHAIMEEARKALRARETYLRDFCKYYGVPSGMIPHFVKYVEHFRHDINPDCLNWHALDYTVRHLLYQANPRVYISENGAEAVRKDAEKFGALLESVFKGKLAEGFAKGMGAA